MSFAEHGLGKSLSEVFARTPRKDGGKGYLEIDLAAIAPPKDNPRKQFDAAALADLTESVRLHGILPLVTTLVIATVAVVLWRAQVRQERRQIERALVVRAVSVRATVLERIQPRTAVVQRIVAVRL
jgi:ParB family chromosome partitioning protein